MVGKKSILVNKPTEPNESIQNIPNTHVQDPKGSLILGIKI